LKLKENRIIGRRDNSLLLFKNMDTKDEIIKQREEKKELRNDIDFLLNEKDKAIENLTKERRNLEEIRKEKEKFITEREIEVKNKLFEIENKIVKSQSELKDLEVKSIEVVEDIKVFMEIATNGIIGLINKAEDMISSSENLKNQSELIVSHLNKTKEDLESKVLKNSELEKNIKKREKEVEIKNKKAEDKLEEAKNLTFWHKEPGAKY